jgi:hypothetical protein
VLVTHETNEAEMTRALAEIARLPAVLEKPAMIRIEDDTDRGGVRVPVAPV